MKNILLTLNYTWLKQTQAIYYNIIIIIIIIKVNI